MTQVIHKLNDLNNAELIRLAHELRQTSVPEDALLREVIKGTELESTPIMLSFIAISSNLAQVLADRLVSTEKLLLNMMENNIKN